MQRRHLLGLLGTAPFMLAFQNTTLANVPKIKRKCLIEAHRGNSGHAPENTIAAIQEALEIGVDRVEVDLEFTANEKLIVLHDNTVDRTTNGSGRVSALPYSKLKLLDAGSWKAPAYAGQHIPLLSEVFELCKGKAMVNIDLKNMHAIPGLVKLVKNMNMSEHIVLTGLIPQATATIRELGENLTMFYESSDFFKEALRKNNIDLAIDIAVTEARQLQLPGFLFKADWVTPEVVYKAHKHGLAVNVWNVNTLEMGQAMADANADAIMTDYPELFV